MKEDVIMKRIYEVRTEENCISGGPQYDGLIEWIRREWRRQGIECAEIRCQNRKNEAFCHGSNLGGIFCEEPGLWR